MDNDMQSLFDELSQNRQLLQIYIGIYGMYELTTRVYKNWDLEFWAMRLGFGFRPWDLGFDNKRFEIFK